MKPLIRQFKRWVGYGEPGFTLIELLIVIAVLGSLASVVVPNVSNMLGSANVAAANTEVANVKTASNSHLADYSLLPVNSWDLYPVAGQNASATEYLSGPPKATYTFNQYTGRVSNVVKVANGWTGVTLF